MRHAGSKPHRRRLFTWELAVDDDEHEREDAERHAEGGQRGHEPRIGTRERALLDRALDRALPVRAVDDAEGSNEPEADAGDGERPPGDVADAGDDLADPNADRQRGQTGAPPGE